MHGTLGAGRLFFTEYAAVQTAHGVVQKSLTVFAHAFAAGMIFAAIDADHSRNGSSLPTNAPTVRRKGSHAVGGAYLQEIPIIVAPPRAVIAARKRRFRQRPTESSAPKRHRCNLDAAPPIIIVTVQSRKSSGGRLRPSFDRLGTVATGLQRRFGIVARARRQARRMQPLRRRRPTAAPFACKKFRRQVFCKRFHRAALRGGRHDCGRSPRDPAGSYPSPFRRYALAS